MIADTRTNAGLDNVSTFRKLHIFSKPGERIMAIASAGNLAISQSVLSTLTEGIEDPTFTLTTPLAWGFYAVAFAMSALARRPGRGAQATVLAFLSVILVIAVFYYPTTFGPEQQTVFGWFENDVYVGLLVVATYLGVLRWRGTVLRP